ncbi:transglycosylase SLT domain-containing protein [Shimazuella kribbensis]|uniref:transglycosylase SLT domain-containing protein n=1 Tax=Shimazuella kribbensis TaxID=139808 RepID=UPI00041D4B57|nr:transglycosylase SLT domain-containing protein [Shimazuella kribbensis]
MSKTISSISVFLVGIVITLIGTLSFFVIILLGNNNNYNKPDEAPEQKDIPFQAMYQEIAAKYPSVPWNILAAVHQLSPEYETHMKALNTGAEVSLKDKDPTVLKIINDWSKKRNLDAVLVAALIQAESSWNRTSNSGAVSDCGVGARGYMQVMPCNFSSMGYNADRDGFDPNINIEVGTKVLADCFRMFKETRKALMCYNGGPGGVSNPYSETVKYPGRVLGYYEQYKKENQVTPVEKPQEPDNKVDLVVTMDTVKKWLDAKAKQIAEQYRLQSDSSRSSGQCVKTAQEKKEKKSMTIGTFSFPLSCAIFYTAPDKYTSSDDVTWDYVQKVEVRASEILGGGDGTVQFGNLIMAGGTLPMPTTTKVTIPGGGSRFGCRVHPVTGKIKFHYGVDMPIPTGSAVVSVADGTVVEHTIDGLIGNALVVDHGPMVFNVNGASTTKDFRSRYLHMISVNVKKGQKVIKGQVIAKSGGAQGIVYSTGAHLHFEVYFKNPGQKEYEIGNPYPLLTGQNDSPNMSCNHR